MGLLKRLFSRPKLTKKPIRRQRVRLAVESLEERVLLFGPATISWDGGGEDFQWENMLNWTEDRLPHALDNVDIRVPGDPVTIVLDAPEVDTVIASLYCEENLHVTGGLALSGDSEISGAFQGGRLVVNSDPGGELRLRGGGTFLPEFYDGNVRLLSGSYTLSAEQFPGRIGVVAGLLHIDPSATARFTSGEFQLGDILITGNGFAEVLGSRVNVDGDTNLQNLRLSTEGTVLGGPGYLTVHGTFDWLAGRVETALIS